MSIQMTRLDQIKEIARELWGDKWRVVAHHWADGDVEYFAVHELGVVETDEYGQINGRERLFLSPDGDEYTVRTEHYRKNVDVVESTVENR